MVVVKVSTPPPAAKPGHNVTPRKKYSAKAESAKRPVSVIKARVPPVKVHAPPGIVFVGNLHPHSTELELARRFRTFGKVIEVIIRVACGDVANPQARRHRAPDVDAKIYASVLFESSLHARRAVSMRGIKHRGLPLVVSMNATDLPEMKSISAMEKARIEGRLKQPSLLRRIWGKAKRLTVERTLVLKPDPPPAAVQAAGVPHTRSKLQRSFASYIE